MIGEVFRGCIEQNFESGHDDDIGEDNDGVVHIEVRKNETFLSEMLFCIKHLIENALAVVGTGRELFERTDVVGATALYVLYRKLQPMNKLPDEKLHKFMWGVQKVVPTVVLADSVMWQLGPFLEEHAWFELRKPDPPNPAAHLLNYLKSF